MTYIARIHKESLEVLLRLAEEQWETYKNKGLTEDRSQIKQALADGHQSLQRAYP